MGGIELRHLETEDTAFIAELVRDTVAAGKPRGRSVVMPTAAPINIPLPPKNRAELPLFYRNGARVRELLNVLYGKCSSGLLLLLAQPGRCHWR